MYTVCHISPLFSGYGNVTPATKLCQSFTMIYGAVGIPLFLITIADLGRFFKTGVMYLVRKAYRKELKKQGERKLGREIAEVGFHSHRYADAIDLYYL